MAPPYCPGMNAMESLSMFPQILAELSVASLENTPKRFKLKFINMTLVSLSELGNTRVSDAISGINQAAYFIFPS